MKNLPTFDDFINENYLNELQNAYNKEDLDLAKKNKSQIQVSWSNGNLVISPGSLMDLQVLGFNSITVVLDYKNKIIKGFFMDDWSDFKKIKSVQQFVSDLIKIDAIDKKWKIIIGSSKESTKINLGGDFTVDSLLKYNADFSNSINICFHGTSDYFIEGIKKYGLLPSGDTLFGQNWDIGYTEKSTERIYLSIDYDRASYYAEHTVDHLKTHEKIESKPIVVEIRNLPINNVVADDDFLTNMGQINLIQYLMAGKKIDPENYIQGIRSSSQFAYNGRISKSLIYKIHYIK